MCVHMDFKTDGVLNNPLCVVDANDDYPMSDQKLLLISNHRCMNNPDGWVFCVDCGHNITTAKAYRNMIGELEGACEKRDCG